MINKKYYEMDDGTTMTVDEVMAATGLSRQGAGRRLKLSRDKNWVCLPMGHPDLIGGPSGSEDVQRDWDEEVKVYGGIAMNPPALDGAVKGDKSFDRYGNPLSYSERTALANHKQKHRDAWLASINNNKEDV